MKSLDTESLAARCNQVALKSARGREGRTTGVESVVRKGQGEEMATTTRTALDEDVDEVVESTIEKNSMNAIVMNYFVTEVSSGVPGCGCRDPAPRARVRR